MATKSVKSLNKTLKNTINTAKGLGIDTGKAESVSRQTDREGGKSYKGSVEEQEFNTITSASLKQNKPYVPPEKPQVTDPGNLALAGNAGIASILEPLGFTQNDNGQIGMGDILKFQQDNQPELPNLENQYYGSREYKDVKRAQREVTDYTSQLNSITANSQAQQLSLEGQGRGQTSSFVGGEQARINREAAIQALPIQAQLSASQGNLEFAQKQLDTVFTLRSQDAQNKYKFETDRLNSIVSFLNQAETRQYNARMQDEERSYSQTQNNINYLRQLSAEARDSGDTSVIGQLGAIDPASPTFEQDVARLAQKIQKPVATGGGYGLTPAQINSTVNTIAGAYDAEPVVKEYNTIRRNLEIYNSLGDSATDDIQRVYTFAKVADPNSAVKEGEYDSIEKYAQAVAQRAGLKLNRFFSPTGILTPEARKAMGTTLQSSLRASETGKNQVQAEYQRQIDDAYAGKPRTITQYTPPQQYGPVQPDEDELQDLEFAQPTGFIGGIKNFFSNLF